MTATCNIGHSNNKNDRKHDKRVTVTPKAILMSSLSELDEQIIGFSLVHIPKLCHTCPSARVCACLKVNFHNFVENVSQGSAKRLKNVINFINYNKRYKLIEFIQSALFRRTVESMCYIV